MNRKAQFLLSYRALPGATVSTREEDETVSYQFKMVIFALALVVVVSGAILGSWVYLEFEHLKEQRQVEASITDCWP